MSGEKSQNVQDVFLNHIRKNKVPVTIFLINGVKLQGVVSSFDNFSLVASSGTVTSSSFISMLYRQLCPRRSFDSMNPVHPTSEEAGAITFSWSFNRRLSNQRKQMGKGQQ